MQEDLINSILTYGGIGSLIFTGFIVFAAYSGIAKAMRDEAGNLRKKKDIKTFLGIVLFIFTLLGILIYGTSKFAALTIGPPEFLKLWACGFGIFFIIHLYDLVIIDYLVIVVWHPKFLRLPDTDYYRTIPPHVKGFFKGLPLGMFASALSSIIVYWMK